MITKQDITRIPLKTSSSQSPCLARGLLSLDRLSSNEKLLINLEQPVTSSEGPLLLPSPEPPPTKLAAAPCRSPYLLLSSLLSSFYWLHSMKVATNVVSEKKTIISTTMAETISYWVTLAFSTFGWTKSTSVSSTVGITAKPFTSASIDGRAELIAFVTKGLNS